MTQWDVIIIGAGVSGLSAGILLADSGKKVLVLEKSGHVGGRAYGTTYKGHVMDNGLHTPSSVGHLERIFDLLKKPFPIRPGSFNEFELYQNGVWADLMGLVDHKKLREMIQEIGSYTHEEIQRYDEISLKDWVSERTDSQGLHLYFECFAAAALAANRYDRFSAGELFFFMKEHMEKTGRFGGEFHLWDGGLQRMGRDLQEGLKELGGEIRTNANVKGIVIENGRACGVEVQTGERIVPNQFLPTEIIRSSAVICTLPLWNLFKVVDPEDLPPWYADWVGSIRHKVRTIWTMTCGLNGMLESMPNEWMCKCAMPGDSKTGTFFAAIYNPGYAPQGEYQASFWWQGDYDEVPDVFSLETAGGRRRARDFFALCDEDLKVFVPDLEEHLLWKIYHVSPFGMSWIPGMRSARPRMEVPGIKNLYLAGDTLWENRGDGMQSAAGTAGICAERILEKSGSISQQ